MTTSLKLAVPLTLIAASASAQAAPPIRHLGPAIAATTEPLGLPLGGRRLSDGRLIVDDAQRRRLLMFDSTLARVTVLADSAPGAPLKYGPNPAPIIGYLGDSTLFLDAPARAFIVLDPSGKQARVAAVPKATDVLWFNGTRAFADPQGRIVYRGGPIGNPTKDTGQKIVVIRLPDSIPVVRASFETRTVDTAARLKLPVVQENQNVKQPEGGSKQTVMLFGASWVDDWTMTSDGFIAAVRGHDYHIDWTGPDGVHTSTPRMPFDWQRVEEAEKRRVADSAAKETQDFLDKTKAQPERLRPDGTPAPRIAARADMLTGSLQVMSPDAVAVAAPLDRIPDYHQPFRAGTTLADRNGNVWILPVTTTRSTGGLVYDVVNRAGTIVERVELPPERSILEFGPGDVVYLMQKLPDGVFRVERRAILRK
ncbi:MAG TPA: hypothetical protein VE967_12600 [Gemmatimonadaceae bacterium]|nr:hypothetical protein [Gemmatimonadaceae bacterium]